MKWIIPFISLVLLTCNTFAQTPEKVSYQAVIRNNNNELVTNSKVNLRIILRQGSPDGYIAYQENHQAMTNVNGLVSLQIGEGNKEFGEFSGIDWSQGPYFIETQIDVKNTHNFSVTGVSEMLSVPYALHAKSADSFTGDGDELAFDKWDKDITDDFSGSFNDLSEVPDLYTKNQVDSLVINLDGGDGIVHSLNLEGEKLSISGGNTISFGNWDTDASDDFDGAYLNLTGTPDVYTKAELYTKTEVDNLVSGKEEGAGSTSQNLSLDANELSISGGNTISYDNWDTDASNDFDGEYTSLNGAPKVYTQDEVNAIKAEILLYVKDNYSPKASIVSLSSSRNVLSNDVGNTIACTTSATLTINTEFSGMKVGEIINLEVHGTTLTVNGATGVIINGNSGGIISIGNNSAYTGGLIRKLANNSYIVL